MEFLKKFDLSNKQLLNFGGVVIIALAVLLVFIKALAPGNYIDLVGNEGLVESVEYSYGDGAVDYYSKDMNVVNPVDAGFMDPGLRAIPSTLGAPDIGIWPPYNPGTTGNDAEEYEVKNYTIDFESTNADKECSAVSGLKSRKDVIFENTGEYEQGCNYTFKVENESAAGVLAMLKDLNPKNLNENSYTIKNEVSGQNNEIKLLEEKLATIDKTLNEAVASYESITDVATKAGDVESLSRIIDSKINLIERLTNAKMEINNQVSYINQSKTDSLDRLNYTYFYVNVYENKLTDGNSIKDSWKLALQQLVRDANRVVQDLSLGVVTLIMEIIKYAVYFVILLFVTRLAYLSIRRVWGKERKDGAQQ